MLKVLDTGLITRNGEGGYTTQSDGYLYIHKELVEPEFYPMLEKDRYVLVHRYIIAKSLGRCLNSDEIVHHIDGNKTNNDLSNLEITTRSQHVRNHHPELIVLATKTFREKKSVERLELNNSGIITAQQAADLSNVAHSTIRRRQERGLLSDISTKYNGRCLLEKELTENAHLWRKSPKKREANK